MIYCVNHPKGDEQLRYYEELLQYHAKTLRKHQTPEEKHLWYDFLASFRPRFRRQQIIGKYILDFYCASCCLAVELDGGQHYEVEARQYDDNRTERLEKQGIHVLRFTNVEIKRNFTGVCMAIEKEVLRRRDPPSTTFGGPPPP